MAPSQRKHDALVALLQREGRRFGFFQAVQILHRVIPDSVPVGELGPPQREAVRFRHDPSLVFHAGDIDGIEVRDLAGAGPRALMTTTFLGLVGSASPLGIMFSEEVLRAEPAEGEALRAFYDLFHHRLVSLFYRTWKKHRFSAGFRRDAGDPFTRRMLAFVGVDAAGATPKRGLAPLERLALAPLLSSPARTARSLQIVLERLMPGMCVDVVQFASRRVQVREEDRCSLGLRNNVLGGDFTVGRSVLDCAGRFRVVVGPLDYGTFEALMPGGERYARMRDIVLQFSPAHLEPELELVLAPETAPRFQLGSERGARLGVTTHLTSGREKTMRARVVMSEDTGTAVPRLISEEEAAEADAAAVA